MEVNTKNRLKRFLKILLIILIYCFSVCCVVLKLFSRLIVLECGLISSFQSNVFDELVPSFDHHL